MSKIPENPPLPNAPPPKQPTPPTPLAPQDQKTQDVAKRTWPVVAALRGSKVLFPLVKRAALITAVTLVGLYLIGTPPGWVTAAVALTSLAVSCLLQPKQAIAELGSIKRYIRGENHWHTPENQLESTIFTGHSPNRLVQSREGEKTFAPSKGKRTPEQVSLFIGEKWETKPKGIFIPYNKEDLRAKGVNTEKQILLGKDRIPNANQLNQAADAINDAVLKGQNIYIHNRSDQNLRALPLAAYYIKHRGMDAAKAAEAAGFSGDQKLLEGIQAAAAEESSSIEIPPTHDRSILINQVKDFLRQGNTLTLNLYSHIGETEVTEGNAEQELQSLPTHVIYALANNLTNAAKALNQRAHPEHKTENSLAHLTLSLSGTKYSVEGSFLSTPQEVFPPPENLPPPKVVTFSTELPMNSPSDPFSITLKMNEKTIQEHVSETISLTENIPIQKSSRDIAAKLARDLSGTTITVNLNGSSTVLNEKNVANATKGIPIHVQDYLTQTTLNAAAEFDAKTRNLIALQVSPKRIKEGSTGNYKPYIIELSQDSSNNWQLKFESKMGYYALNSQGELKCFAQVKYVANLTIPNDPNDPSGVQFHLTSTPIVDTQTE